MLLFLLVWMVSRVETQICKVLVSRQIACLSLYFSRATEVASEEERMSWEFSGTRYRGPSTAPMHGQCPRSLAMNAGGFEGVGQWEC